MDPTLRNKPSMHPVDLALQYLPLSGLAFSSVALGLAIHGWIEEDIDVPLYQIGPDGKTTYLGTTHLQVPWQYKLLLGSAAWSIALCAFLVLVPFAGPRAWVVSRAFRFVNLVLNGVTALLWVGALYAIVSRYGAHVVDGEFAAQEAFTVLPWLVFLFLTFLNICTAYGVLESGRPGYGTLFRKYQDVAGPDEDHRADEARPLLDDE